MIDVEKIRADFPYLDSEKVGKEVIYLDTGATSQKPAYVIDAVDEYYRYSNANPHRGAHFLSWKATEAYEETREVVKDFIGARKSSEIVFTRSTTEALNLLAYSYGLNNLKKDDEILITILEHHANLVPWQMVTKKTGAKLVYAYLNDDYSLDYDDLKSKINDKTKIVSVTGASNVTGELIDSKLITKWAHEVGAISIVDGAQLIPHVKTDVKDIDCDFLVFSGHKMFSPMGIGVLYGKYELLDKLEPFNYGGDMIEYVYEQESTFQEPPIKFEAGTPNVGGVLGLKAAIEYVEKIGMDEIFAYEHELTSYAYDLIKDIPNIKIFYPTNGKAGSVISFTFTDIHPHDIATILDSKGIAVRSGHHCAMPLHGYLGISATARASFSIYNTKEEAEIFARELKNVRKVMGL
ncbi:cysteine desulfurase [Anaerococcus sp.]|uniref:cysteine desulfurase n=1 Tax=Anaerococcus sp. TaxID=1872515 RepID=UPI002632A2A3|nr:cysteine desulfurase [Anaerococcus sp.]MDD6918055.1 cysteine desulfurase [Peptoniphilaceae bacterium]MDY2928545.1 cysteine desulfurase [Anaerococcus sp.]